MDKAEIDARVADVTARVEMILTKYKALHMPNMDAVRALVDLADDLYAEGRMTESEVVAELWLGGLLIVLQLEEIGRGEVAAIAQYN